MHERVFENQNAKIIYITKKEGFKDIAVDKCVKISSRRCISLKDFTSSGEMFFPKHKLKYSSNHLISMEIIEKKQMNQVSIRMILKKLLPTVFDSKIISELNLKAFLVQNQERIRSMCYTILGNKFKREIDQLNASLVDSTQDTSTNTSSEEEIMFDDIIENDYFQMQLQE